MILSDGAKMDINSLVLGGGDTKVPYVKDGVICFVLEKNLSHWND